MDEDIQVFLRTILLESGRLVMSYYGAPLAATQKTDPSQVVTQVDLASERLITAKISEHFPEHSIIAEESGFIDKKSEYVWIIDPIDGTSNYAKGLPWFGIMIALLQQWEPVAVGIYLPVTNELYTAEKGKGAFRNNEQFVIDQHMHLHESLVSYCIDPPQDALHTKLLVQTFANLLPHVRNIRSTNSAVDYAYAAEGKLGGLINFSNKIWDAAPVSLLAKEAGCVVTDQRGQRLDFRVTKETFMKNFTLVIAPPAMHKQLLQFIPQHLSS